MIRIRVLHIGDIHFSPERLKASQGDFKDRQFPSQVASVATPRPLMSAIRMIDEVTEKHPVDAVVIVGDLADKGNLMSYKECADYLIKNLKLGVNYSTDKVHCVPGNHDLDIRSINFEENKPESKLWEKFSPLKEVWKDKDVDILAADNVRISRLSKNSALLRIISLNSCVGCGEYRGIPEKARTALIEAEPSSQETAALWEFREQLDTPCFANDHLEHAIQEIDSADEHSLSIILAHHNLLPQSLARVAPYSELLNGGLLRTTLAEGKASVLYCHGHIHTDPVELVGNPSHQPCKLITISAPLIDSGFNIIETHFSNEGVPLGVEIQQYRVSAMHAFITTPTRRIRIPLRSSRNHAEILDNSRSELCRTILQYSGEHASKIKESVELQCGTISEEEFSDVLLELQWHGYLVIEFEDRPFRQWRIRTCL